MTLIYSLFTLSACGPNEPALDDPDTLDCAMDEGSITAEFADDGTAVFHLQGTQRTPTLIEVIRLDDCGDDWWGGHTTWSLYAENGLPTELVYGESLPEAELNGKPSALVPDGHYYVEFAIGNWNDGYAACVPWTAHWIHGEPQTFEAGNDCTP